MIFAHSQSYLVLQAASQCPGARAGPGRVGGGLGANLLPQSLTRSANSGAAGGVARMQVSVTPGHITVVAADCAGAGRRVAVVPGPGGAYDD
jgi:hypothetical protein